ncbi:hypothetical protein ACOSQ2_027346 [Xanthoceras sorbifolium]
MRKERNKLGETITVGQWKQTNLLLQLTVEVVARGWHDANVLLSKQILMHHSSGFGWDPITKKFIVSEKVWKNYFKVIIGVEDRHVGIEDYVFDENNNAFVQSEHEPSHQASFRNMDSEIPSKNTNYKKRNKTVVVKNLSQVIDSISTDFQGVCSLMEKRESDREKREIEKKEKERKKLDSFAHYKALALLNIKTRKDVFLKMCNTP